MFDWGADKVKELLEYIFTEWTEDVMNWVLGLMNELVFSIPESDFVNNVLNFFVWFNGMFAVILILYKIIEYIINTQNGTQQYPLDEILLRAIKSAAGMLILPWILKVVVIDICLPIANYFTSAGTEFSGDGFGVIKATIEGSTTVGPGITGMVVLLLLIFMVIVFVFFLFSVCVFYADYIVMQVLIAPVCLSMIADDNNYLGVWWRELLSIVTSLLVKIFLMTLVINILFAGGNMFLCIGAGVLIIKTPSVLKNMWYGGGGARAVSRGFGAIGSMGSRTLLRKLM
ncbi:conjugal transfer protein TrbL family protein [Paraliobacillus ryukyuensis]|uniref:conjugal transfer protein TrbL family protein n=1 Tax=Paraliobacillus ryukyuensis TaxID=200904 RepID=UPI0009A5E0D1|nr:conjugal transfer protein TrbL family protein [Paraliobacillus ryukyuensis]